MSTETKKKNKKKQKKAKPAKPHVFKDLSFEVVKSHEPVSRYGAKLMSTDPFAPQQVAAAIPKLMPCVRVGCDKKEQKYKEFSRCPRCHLIFCSEECHRADHKVDKQVQCKAIGKKIEELANFYDACKDGKCGANFREHNKKNCFVDFDACGACQMRQLFTGAN